MDNKIFINANQLLSDAFTLGKAVWDSGFRPDLIVGLWRGGSPVAIAVHELFARLGVNVDHLPLRTRLYSGIDQRAQSVEITGMEYVNQRIGAIKNILLVDDIFDTGTSMSAVVSQIESDLNSATETRIATVWFKPTHNKSKLRPDYYVHSTDKWIVFPHELCDIAATDLFENKEGIATIKPLLK
ncbi:MAG TPA: hypoxanthine phosphoribosyltransferase [Porticoccaceae bacterium]|nr:hypoxanthine phosphoribosyltransferase [Porticoccaceae bacterium]